MERERVDIALRELRAVRGLSAHMAARRAGLSKAAVLAWEGGRRMPTGALLVRLLDALEADPRLRASLLHAADPAQARMELAHSPRGAPVGLGEALRAMRVRRRTTQADLARTVGVAQGTVAKWETGAAEPNAETIHALGFALGATAEETVALSTVQGGHGPLGGSVDPEEAPERIYHTLRWGDPLSEVMAMAYEAEAWRRAARDPRWDATLCRAISVRAFHDFWAGAPGLGEVHARRAIRIAHTPEAKRAAVVALDIASEVAKRRGDDPAAAESLAGVWADALPEGNERAWARWIQAVRLAALGRQTDSLEAVRRLIGAMQPPLDGVRYRSAAQARVHLVGGDARSAAEAIRDLEPDELDTLFLHVEVRHAMDEPAPAEWMVAIDGIRRSAPPRGHVARRGALDQARTPPKAPSQASHVRSIDFGWADAQGVS